MMRQRKYFWYKLVGLMNSRFFTQPIINLCQPALNEETLLFLQGKLDEVIFWQQRFQEEHDDLNELLVHHTRQNTLFYVSPEQKERLPWLVDRLRECHALFNLLTRMKDLQSITTAEQQWLLVLPDFQQSVVACYPYVIDVQSMTPPATKTFL